MYKHRLDMDLIDAELVDDVQKGPRAVRSFDGQA